MGKVDRQYCDRWKWYQLALVREGATRWVILSKWYAFKFPRPSPWRNRLWGRLANEQETHFWTMAHPLMCPVLFSVWGGWLVVMPRCRIMLANDWISLDMDDLLFGPVPAERKHSSWGFLDGRVVCVDYGGPDAPEHQLI